MSASIGRRARACSLLVILLAFGCDSATPTTPSNPQQTPPSSNVQAALESLALGAAAVKGGSAVSGTVTLSAAAPAAGFPVALASSSAAATVPATMTIAAGATSGTFSVTTDAVGLEQTATITATAGDVSRTATLAIRPAPGDGPIAAFTTQSDDLIGGESTRGTVALGEPAPAGGVRFTLASSDDVIDVPASITIPEGATSASFEIDTRPVTVEQDVTITIAIAPVTAAKGARGLAAAGNASATLVIKVLPEPASPPALTSLSPSTGVQGATVAVTLTGTDFIAGASIAVSGAGVTVSGVTVASETSITATFTIDAGAATGAREVTVTTSAGTSGAQTFTITAAPTPAPTVTAISPTSGTTLGGTAVTLTGTNLTGATGVTFGGTAATAVTVVSATNVTATTPAHAAGAVDVVITTPGGSATLTGGYTYVTPAPTFTAISPTSGLAAGGTAVTLTGTDLTGTTGVMFDGVAATAVTVVNATTVTATTPAHAVGTVDVVVTTPGGSATRTNGYQYLSGSTLTAIAATSGSASGGTGITLTGTGLTGATGVTFDGVAATSVNVVNATTVTAVTPVHAAGAVNVVISTPAGGATLAGGYTYVATAVGQAAHGGIIAALNGGLNDLIAATADNSAGIVWEGGAGNTWIGAGAQSTTDGAANTTAIVNALGAGSYAAQVCSDLEVDSQGNTPCQAGNTCYNDWFLPAGNNLTATGQLNALRTNRVAIGGFASTWYWSSTEFTPEQANDQNFSTAVQDSGSKDSSFRVRCVRAFTPGG